MPGLGQGQMPGQGQGQQPGQGQGQGLANGNPGGQPGNNPNGQPGGGGGIKIAMDGRTIEEPKEVQDVGISPSDWARLSPELQSQLLHSAQQPGPPGYRDMIKNYYSRIARMQGQNGGTK